MSKDSNPKLDLSYSARKALSVHIGEAAGQEIADLLTKMANQIEELKRTKVSITPVIPQPKAERSPLAALDNEEF
jgi:hypothetical protein